MRGQNENKGGGTVKGHPSAPSRRAWKWWILWAFLLIVLAGLAVLLARRPPRAERLRRKAVQYLRLGQTREAVEQFRAALALDPDHLDAREGLVQALGRQKQFEEAFAEADALVRRGYPAAQAAFLKAELYRLRAEQRVAAAGAEITATLCDDILSNEIDPAIRLCQENAAQTKTPADAYIFLGDLISVRGRLLTTKRLALVRETSRSADAARTSEGRAHRQKINAVSSQLKQAETAARRAYEEALKYDADSEGARLALARMALRRFVPDPARARDLVAPLLKRAPDNVAACLVMVSADRAAEDYAAALDHLRGIPAAKRTDEILLLEAQTLVDLARWEEAEKILQDLSARRQRDRTVDFLRARTLIALGRDEPALTLLQNLFASRERTYWPEARYELAKLLLKTGRREQALSAFRQTLDDVSATTVVQQARLRKVRVIRYESCMTLAREMRSASLKTAVEHAREAFFLFPERGEALALARDLLIQQKDTAEIRRLVMMHIRALIVEERWDAALEACRSELALAPPVMSPTALRIQIARLFLRKGDFRNALTTYQELSQQHPESTAILMEIVEMHRRLNQHAEAAKVLERVLTLQPEHGRARVLLAAMWLRVGREEDARALVAAISRDPKAGPEFRRQLVQIHESERDYASAAAVAGLFVKEQPKDPILWTILADAEWLNGRRDAARAAFTKAFDLDPYLPSVYRRALLDIREGRADDALSLLQAGAKTLPKLGAIYLYTALAHHVRGDMPSAIRTLEFLCSGTAAPLGALDLPRTMLSVIVAAQGKFDQAMALDHLVLGTEELREDRRDFLRALADAPAEIREKAALPINLVVAFSTANVAPEALAQCDTVVSLFPDAALPHCWRAQILDSLGKHDEAVRIYQDIAQRRPDAWGPKILLAQSHAAHENPSAAIAILEEMEDRVPVERRAWVHMTLGALYEQRGALDAALAAYHEAMSDPAYEASASNAAAWLLVSERNDPKAALDLAARALELQPEDPYIQDTYGWVLHQLGDTEKAVQHLRKARAALPGSAAVRYHLGAALLTLGRADEARSELENALMISETFPEADAARDLLKSLKP